MDAFEKSRKFSENDDEIDLLKLFSTLLEARWFILLLTATFSMTGFLYAFSVTPIYKADALIQIEKNNSSIGMFAFPEESMLLSDSAGAEVEILKSRMILGKTVDKFNFSTQVMPNYFPLFGQRLAVIFGRKISVDIAHFEVPAEFQNTIYTLNVVSAPTYDFTLENDNGEKLLEGKVGEVLERNGYSIHLETLDATEGESFTLWKRSYIDSIEWLKSNFRINERGDTGVFELLFEGENCIQNQRVLKDILVNYVTQDIERNSAEAEQSLIFLNDSLPKVKQHLTYAEDALKQYRQENDSVDLNLEAQVKLKGIVRIQDQLNDLALKETEIAQRYTLEHPVYTALLGNRKVLLKDQKKLNLKIQQLPSAQREILRLTRDLEVNQQIYLLLLNKIQELQILKASTLGKVRILDEPISHSTAVKPHKKIIVVLFTMMGALIAIFISLLTFAFTRGIKESSEIEAIGIPVISCIPFSKLQSKTTQNRQNNVKLPFDDRLLTKGNPSDLTIEAIRNLRTNLQYSMTKSKNNILMISSSNSGVGKSFLSANLSVVIADTETKVLLVDADLRKGTIHDYFCLESNVGLSEILTEQFSHDQVLKGSGIDNLSLITRGSIPINPAELLNNLRFKQFIDWASDNYDLVILDTPPILAVTDASIIGSYAGMSLLVGRFSVTKIKEVEAAFYRLSKAGVKVDGFVLNAVKREILNYSDMTYQYG